MELSGILDTDNSMHLFTLNLVFQRRINQALCQFTEAFNHQNVRTEKKLVAIPNVAYQMMQPDNPLSNAKSYDFEYYGDDPDGPTPFDSDNNVVVEEIDLGQHDSVQSFVLERVDPLRESSQMEVDIFQEALELVTVKLGQLIVA